MSERVEPGHYGFCDRSDCGEPADYMVEVQRADTGELEQHSICEWHFRDFTSLCDIEGCEFLGHNKAPARGTRDDATKEALTLRFCDPHLHDIRAGEVTVTLKGGVRLVHDGQGHLKLLPRNIGRG